MIQKIEAARQASDFEAWHSYKDQFRLQICSFDEKKVCCCQDGQQYDKSNLPNLNGNFSSFENQFDNGCGIPAALTDENGTVSNFVQ